MAQRIRLAHETADWTADVDEERVTLSSVEGTFAVRALGDGRFLVEGPSGPHECFAAVAGDEIWIGMPGIAERFHMRGSDERPRSSARDQDALMPPMAATVVRINVHAGDRVAAGDTLIVLEAMKMELPVRAPRDATIRAVNCEEGQLVQPGTVLVELDE